MQIIHFYKKYGGHLLSQTPVGPAKMFEIANVQDSNKLKIHAFSKVLSNPNIAFTSALTLVSLKCNRREKIYQYFYSK